MYLIFMILLKPNSGESVLFFLTGALALLQQQAK